MRPPTNAMKRRLFRRIGTAKSTWCRLVNNKNSQQSSKGKDLEHDRGEDARPYSDGPGEKLQDMHGWGKPERGWRGREQKGLGQFLAGVRAERRWSVHNRRRRSRQRCGHLLPHIDKVEWTDAHLLGCLSLEGLHLQRPYCHPFVLPPRSSSFTSTTPSH